MGITKISLLQEPLNRAVNCIREYNAILWAGSGLSLYAGYPSGSILCEKILEKAEKEEDYKILEYSKNSLMDISNEYLQLYSREKLIDIIKESFDISPVCEPITHMRIVNIPQISTIITTNYDHLFEDAFKNNITVCTGTSFKKTIRGVVDLYKIHGDTSKPDSIILTNKDYSQFYDALDTILWNKIKSILAEKSVIFVGYSLEDKNIQDVFEKILSQVDIADKEFFIVTPELQEHKLKALNKICKTTHIPLTGEEFLDYIENEIRKYIVVDALKKRVEVDEAYRICRENGITPTLKNEPFGNKTKTVVEKLQLTPDTFFGENGMPFERGASFTSNPKTYNDMLNFLNDCDCREIILPAEDAIMYQNINGIYIPEHQKIRGKFPDVVKIVKSEMVRKAKLIMEGDKEYNVCIKAIWGNVRTRLSVELACININILHDKEFVRYDISYRCRHSIDDAFSDLNIIKLWCNGIDLKFCTYNENMVYILRGSEIKDKVEDFKAFVIENLELYNKINIIQENLNDIFEIPKDMNSEDIRNINRAYASLEPTIINFTDDYLIEREKMTREQLKIYYTLEKDHSIILIYPDIIAEDCLELFGKDIILGKRKIKIVEPYLANIEEVEEAIEKKQKVLLKIRSKREKAILEYIEK